MLKLTKAKTLPTISGGRFEKVEYAIVEQRGVWS
jgi:hypothetical protein